MARLNIIKLVLEYAPDRSEIHATLADGSVRRCYRIKSSHLSGRLLLRQLAEERGLTLDKTGTIATKEPIGERVA